MSLSGSQAQKSPCCCLLSPAGTAGLGDGDGNVALVRLCHELGVCAKGREVTHSVFWRCLRAESPCGMSRKHRSAWRRRHGHRRGGNTAGEAVRSACSLCFTRQISRAVGIQRVREAGTLLAQGRQQLFLHKALPLVW